MSKIKKTKRVEYSYATSPNANRFKLKDGGYCVEIVKHTPETQPGIAVAGFTTIEQAKAYAETLPEPWDKLTQ